MENNLSNKRRNQKSKYINKNNLIFLSGDKFRNTKINYHMREQDLINSGIITNKNSINTNINKKSYLKYAKNYINKFSKIKALTPSHNISFKLGPNSEFSNKIFDKDDLTKSKDSLFIKKDISNISKKELNKSDRYRNTKDIKNQELNNINKDDKINNNHNNNKINYYLKNIKNSKSLPINNKFLKNYIQNLRGYIKYENDKKNFVNNPLIVEQGNSYNKENRQKNLLLSFNSQNISSKQKLSFENINNSKSENRFNHNNNFQKLKNNSIREKRIVSRKEMKLISPKNKESILKEFKTPMYKLRKKFFKNHDISLVNKIKLNSLSTREHNIKLNEQNKSEIFLYSNEKEINKDIESKSEIKKKEIVKGYFAVSKAGKDKNFLIKINQDYYIIEKNINGLQNFNLFCVLDGHGLYGHIISLFVGKYITNTFINHTEIKACVDVDEIYFKIRNNNFYLINEIFVNAEKELYNGDFDSNFSGTTCILVIQLGHKLICANTGDSRAILIYNEKGQFDDGTSKENEINFYQIKNIIAPFSKYKNNFRDSFKENILLSSSGQKILKEKILRKTKLHKKLKNLEKIKTSIFCLSNDLKPTLPLEKQRILDNGGKVEQYKDKYGKAIGPYRVWVKDEMFPGLAMSRSIGDFIATSVGVIPNPEIIEYNLNKGSKYMIIASDGLWQYMSNEKVMYIGNQYYPGRDPIDICNELVKEANICWDNQGVPTDDITVLVVYF